MRAMLHVSAETLTATLYIASFAVVIGSVAIVYTQSLRTGLLIAGHDFHLRNSWASPTACGGCIGRDSRLALEPCTRTCTERPAATRSSGVRCLPVIVVGLLLGASALHTGCADGVDSSILTGGKRSGGKHSAADYAEGRSGRATRTSGVRFSLRESIRICTRPAET